MLSQVAAENGADILLLSEQSVEKYPSGAGASTWFDDESGIAAVWYNIILGCLLAWPHRK